MNVMVIGGGGREHAIIKCVRQNPRVKALYALPGNGGIAQDATCVPITATDIGAIVAFAKEKAIDFAIVAPDDPLVMGAVDALHGEGIRCFGPDRRAALIEGSKSFAKDLMQRHGIPTAAYAAFDEEAGALAYLDTCAYPAVVKADGLALGKGVIIAQDKREAESAVRAMMSGGQFGDSGKRIVIEEFLTGPEVTVLAFADGKTIIPMVASMDHKRALDDDRGLNTGGMGVIAPNPFYTPEMAARCMREIYQPTLEAMKEAGRPFKGCLYFGLMLTADGPKVIEYNCRFGDPEAQAVLPLLRTDLLDIMEAVEDGRLAEADVRFSSDATCCVMLASGGYPERYDKGYPISIGDMPDNVIVFHSGTALRDDRLVTAGGRVLGVTARAATLADAVSEAYAAVRNISFEKMHYRQDIGKRAVEAE